MISLAITLAVAGLLYLLINYLVARVAIYPPRVPLYFAPGVSGLPQESVEFESGDGTLIRGWWCEADGDVVVIACHGYLMNRCELAPLAGLFVEHGVSSLYFDFRAHGKSDGRRSTVGYEERWDVLAAIEWVRQRKPGARIVLFGSSMGAAASVLATGEAPESVHGLILDGVYRRMDEAGRGWWEFLGGKWLGVVLRPTVWFGRMLTGFDPKTVDVAAVLRALPDLPILFINGDRDVIVPPASAEENYAAAGGMARSEWFAGAGHGEPRFREPERYRELLAEFLRELPQKTTETSATSRVPMSS